MGDWFGDDFLTIMLRIIVAIFLSGIIGMERGLGNHHAGLRTHILVGVASCLMMILSLYGFTEFSENHDYVQFDPARIPSYVISGIGFLGAGTILVNGTTVRGLTTAASVWTVAGLGLVIGAGMYMEAVFTTIVILLILIFLNNFEKAFPLYTRQKPQIVIQITSSNNSAKIMEVIENHKLQVESMEINRGENNNCTIKLTFERGQKINELTVFEELTQFDFVKSVNSMST